MEYGVTDFASVLKLHSIPSVYGSKLPSALTNEQDVQSYSQVFGVWMSSLARSKLGTKIFSPGIVKSNGVVAIVYSYTGNSYGVADTDNELKQFLMVLTTLNEPELTHSDPSFDILHWIETI